ncbi:MAG: polysaccharide deacetylase family protein [Lachnospiraceae bacterium]|nr:polysaccharide deacetylase family protein [Lachnospiraceae bacterium]
MRFVYPQGKIKALTFSYDDGRVYDRRLVSVFNEYGLKGTFHLNSAHLSQERPENSGTGADALQKEDGHVTVAEVSELYKDHEVACHGLEHRNPTGLSPVQMSLEILEDRRNLEKMTGRLVQGLSYAYGNYTEETKQIIRANGIKYSRTVRSTGSLWAPADFLEWHPTCHHNDARLFELADRFLGLRENWELGLMYVWGHSYEFDRDDNWERIEKLAQTLAFKENVWYATNLEICTYLTAVRAQEFSADGTVMHNPTAVTIWVRTGSGVLSVQPGECVTLA